MIIQRYASPNFSDRNLDSHVKFLIIHYTEGNFASGLNHMINPHPRRSVSAHYMIDEDGGVMNFVLESKCAWHAGLSRWRHYQALNQWSIGIELVNPGHPNGYRPYPPAQMHSLIALCQQIIARHDIHPAYVLGHSDIAPTRKIDPGELFDWQWLAREGVGLFPQIGGSPSCMDISHVQTLLSKVGYDIEITGILDQQTYYVLRAFQMHYSPERVDMTIYPEMVARLESLCDVIDQYNKIHNLS